MRKLIVLLSLIVFGGMFPAIGQVISDEEVNELLNGHILQPDDLPNSNLSFIRQVGDENTAISIQEQEGMVSNLVMVNQDGTGNTGYIEQTGSELETLLWQYNLTNEANLWSVGNNIHTEVKQNGVENIINSYIKNHHLDSRTAMLLQKGNNNRIDLDLREASVPGSFDSQVFNITQNGNGHEATVTGVDFNSPITVEQTAGYGGTGMQIEINTSYFSFP